MEHDRNGLQILDRPECLRLLGQATLGRVGITDRALPVVLPVNFLLRDEHVLIRTGSGSKLDAALRDSVVAFEADDFDAMAHTGWSVLVTGIARELTDPASLRALENAPLARWAPQGDDHIMAIETERISGRRLRHGLVTRR